MPGDLQGAPIRTAIERLKERQEVTLALWADLYATLGRALEASAGSDRRGLQLLMAQAESLEEELLGESPITSETWERLGFDPEAEPRG